MQEPPARGAQLKPSVTAHAGSLGTAANTPESFKAALAYPVDFLEADVRFTPEKAAYLSHDALPPALQSGAMRLEDLLRLTAAHATVRLNLDLKEYSGVGDMARLVTAAGMASRVILTGITREAILRVREDADGLPFMLNASPGPLQRFTVRGAAALVDTIRSCGASGLNTHHSFLSGRLARAVSRAGLSVSVWTVDGEREMRRMLRLPVDNITTRRIDRLLALRETRSL
jgi:glycerophosphoryl diester phosphodiesterase